MLKNPKKLSKSFSAQYYNIAQQSTFVYGHVRIYICRPTYVRMYVCAYVCIISHDKIRCFCECSKNRWIQ